MQLLPKSFLYEFSGLLFCHSFDILVFFPLSLSLSLSLSLPLSLSLSPSPPLPQCLSLLWLLVLLGLCSQCWQACMRLLERAQSAVQRMLQCHSSALVFYFIFF